ncbi:fumarylacetoacetate hydrolase domain-containing protein 2 isoform X1 [Trichoplusia ni]|nr:fumarylacetoacetate hydrolase domain-containing protein 2 isoform X1 [Trichoplusia ni]
MKYVQFTYNADPSTVRVGYIDCCNVVDINSADCGMPHTMIDILKKGVVDKVAELRQCNPTSVPLTDVTLVAPIHGVDKILCVALNYADHCREQNLEQPKLPIIFSKFSSTIIGQNEPLRLRTEIVKKVDWEVELAVVIGQKASAVPAAEAYKYIFGYTVAQDISARDWQKEKNGGQFLLGKSQDGFCPIGPCILTSDEIGDPHNLDIKCTLNGVEKQSSNTSNLIHTIPNIIERLTSVMTLLPGDLILTGTPGGVGVHRNPPEFLKPGDVIRSEIQKIGSFEIKVEQF